jgi:hypothetical protein
MSLEPYTGGETPPQQKVPGIKPRLTAWTSRIWRESPGRTIPMFKIEARLEARDVEDSDMSRALRPFSSQLQKIAIYLVHTEEVGRLASWAVGRFDIDAKGAHMFFHDFLGAPNGMLMLNLMQTAGASADIVMGVVPLKVEGEALRFAITEYDLGIHNRIG